MASPNVVQIIADSSQTGAPSQVLFLLKGLRGVIDLSLICPRGWLADQAKELGVAVYLLDEQSRRQAIRQVKGYYRQIKPDIIHCHGVRGGYIGRVAARNFPAKVVYTEHLWTKDFHLPSRAWELIQLSGLRSLSKSTDRTIAVSKAVRDFLVTKRIESVEKISVIYGAIDPLEPVGKSNEPTIGTLGSLTYVKGVDQLLEAVALLRQKHPSIRCVIGGTGPDEQQLKDYAQKLKITSSVQWLGACPDRREYFSKLSIYIQPSLSESFGMAVLEAMSAGLPVVVGDVGALPELVVNEKTGLICPARNSKALSEAISRLITDTQLANQLSNAGRQAASGYTMVKMVEKHQELYQQLHDYSWKA